MMADGPSFADLTTIRVGGPIARFVEPTSRVGLIEAVEDADSAGLPLCLIGGGSNLLAADAPFTGVVVRDARRDINVLDQAAPREGAQDLSVHVNAAAGTLWDDFVAFCIRMGLAGVEGLSGIPGTVGASVVQNIGAYGQEVGSVVDSVEAWDRQEKRVVSLTAAEMGFGYRTSALKTSMCQAPGGGRAPFFPTPRWAVLSVTFVLQHRSTAPVAFDQLAAALGLELGQEVSLEGLRQSVLAVRGRKGMLEDLTRYRNPWMARLRPELSAAGSLATAQPDYDRWSCGSFFVNPVVSPVVADSLPEDAPRFPATDPEGRPAVKTSAAWLIDQAGLGRGWADGQVGAAASLSTRHVLALTNRGRATAADIVRLARKVQWRVRDRFGVDLVPEPVWVGFTDVTQSGPDTAGVGRPGCGDRVG